MHNVRANILAEVSEERNRQEMLREAGKFPATCATIGDFERSDDQCFRILGEEVGEVAEALNERENESARREISPHEMRAMNLHLRDELIQVAAVAIAWVERLTHYGIDGDV